MPRPEMITAQPAAVPRRRADHGTYEICIKTSGHDDPGTPLYPGFGISSVFSATLEQMPDTDQPMLIIRASYQGATPEDMDELVTKPIEDQVSRLEGVKSMSSTSNEGNAMIMLEYDYDADMDDAYNELTRSLNSMRGLPDDCTTSVMEMNMNG